MRKVIAFGLVVLMLFSANLSAFANSEEKNEAENTVPVGSSFDNSIDAKSAVLMEAGSGRVLYSKNESSAYAPASVTKIMTLLLVAEALSEEKIKLDETVTVSEYAASMGGSQVFLKEGESMSVEELIKCTVIASANDAAVALAELVGGSEEAFVMQMNARAMELEMKSTNFENVTGLDDTTVNHVTSAMDIAIMSRELIKHDIILKYSSIWQDTIRDGSFTLTNTNRLVRFYDGCNGLKTGSTDAAGFCMSATAKRDGMQLIAVVMGAPTRDVRNSIAKKLLDYGFASYSLFKREKEMLEEIPIHGGTADKTQLYSEPFVSIVPKESISKIESVYSIPEYLSAPVRAGEEIGKIEYRLNGELLGSSKIYSEENVEKISYLQLYLRMLLSIFDKS